MSNRKWAAIVYGRSYHLDFRFITLPQDFTPQDISWASQHIIATTQQARKLSGSPRWSLFKSDRYCIVGVTCMVRDLIGQPGQDLPEVMTRDDQGRPLYIFVGYVTQLSQNREIDNFPAYRENNLDSFESLYREIEQVWLVKNYDRASRQPVLSRYQGISFSGTTADIEHQVSPLNHCLKHPDKIYLWSNSTQQNNLLWRTSIQCLDATSICLNIQGKALTNSPFLNQSVSSVEQFQVEARTSIREKETTPASEKSGDRASSSLSQKISQRAKEDIDLTLQQAAKVATASQELINNFNDWSTHKDINSDRQSDEESDEADSFGFKVKTEAKKPSPRNKDWF